MSDHLPHNHGTSFKHVEADMPKAEAFDTVSDMLKLMSDSTRMRIFWLLCHGEECVINLSAILEISSPAASHHLKLLKTAGLIISRREGREVYYTAAKTARTTILHDMIEQIIEVACPSKETFEESDSYDSSVQIANEVHRLLTSDLKTWYTIEELAEKFHINQTSLKAMFKTVFGQPIATYMKEYRMNRAKELLLHSNMRISDISFEVGYENPSKFTQAFKGLTGMLPKEYRKKRLP